MTRLFKSPSPSKKGFSNSEIGSNNIRSEIGFKILNFKIVIAFSYLSVIA